MIRNIIFDFGNVLGWTLAEHTTNAFVFEEKERQLIREVVFDCKDWDLLNRGQMTDEQLYERIRDRLPESLWEDACMVYDNWTNTAVPVPGMTRLVRELKEQGYHMYLLSNATQTFSEKCRDIPWIDSMLNLFDGLVFSANIGMAKPDREIFQYMLDTYGLKAEETVFVDDFQVNIDGAKSVGIDGLVFTQDANELRKFLQAHQ